VGHAQWGLPCRLRDDMPGQQVIVGTRWGNMGILTLLSGRGERLWTIQPDYILQGSRPIQWAGGGPQHFWLNTTTPAQGLYDGHGRLVSRLEAIRRLRGDLPPGPVNSYVFSREPGGQDLMAVRIADRVHLFAPG